MTLFWTDIIRYLDHGLQERVSGEHIPLGLGLAVTRHEGHQRLLRRVIVLVESHAHRSQALVGLDHLFLGLPTWEAGLVTLYYSVDLKHCPTNKRRFEGLDEYFATNPYKVIHRLLRV